MGWGYPRVPPPRIGYLLSRPGMGVPPIWFGPGNGLSLQTWDGLPPPPEIPPAGVNKQTDTCEDITFPHPSDAGGNELGEVEREGQVLHPCET